MADPDLKDVAADVKRMKENLDILWLLFGAYLVFFMQVCEHMSLDRNTIS